MKQLSEKEAREYGVYPVHHEMENGELRFRLVSDDGSSYILTKSTGKNGWQKSHVHYCKSEFYIVEKGAVFIALMKDGRVTIKTLCANDSLAVPVGVPHNVSMSEDAVLHTVKFGTKDEDWNACEELDELLANGYEIYRKKQGGSILE